MSLARGSTRFEQWRRHAAKRAAADPFFVASALAVYQRRHRVRAARLAAWLGCPNGDLSKLALAARPDPASPRFAAEVACIAAAVGCDRDRLAELLTEVGAPSGTRDRPVG